MADRAYDCFMAHTKVGGNRKVRRLKPDERWAWIAGVLAIAAEAPERGAFLIAEGVPANADDVADMAGVPKKTADAALKQLRILRMLRPAADGDHEIIHDFDEWNPAPQFRGAAGGEKAVVRDKNARAAIKERDGDGCRYCGVEVNWKDRRSPAGGTFRLVDPEGPNEVTNVVVACRGCDSKPESDLVLLPAGSSSELDQHSGSDLDRPGQVKVSRSEVEARTEAAEGRERAAV